MLTNKVQLTVSASNFNTINGLKRSIRFWGLNGFYYYKDNNGATVNSFAPSQTIELGVNTTNLIINSMSQWVFPDGLTIVKRVNYNNIYSLAYGDYVLIIALTTDVDGIYLDLPGAFQAGFNSTLMNAGVAASLYIMSFGPSIETIDGYHFRAQIIKSSQIKTFPVIYTSPYSSGVFTPSFPSGYPSNSDVGSGNQSPGITIFGQAKSSLIDKFGQVSDYCFNNITDIDTDNTTSAITFSGPSQSLTITYYNSFIRDAAFLDFKKAIITSATERVLIQTPPVSQWPSNSIYNVTTNIQ